MDISKKYIKMCEKANFGLIPKFGDIIYCKSIYETGIVKYSYRDSLNKEWVVFQNRQRDGEIFVYNALKEVFVPLWTQDQLQEMLCHYNSNVSIAFKLWLRNFALWITTSGGGKKFFHIKYKEQFETMEQLWLAFVMHEKYNKIWDNEEQGWREEKENPLNP